MKHSCYAEYENIKIRPLEAEDLETLRVWRNCAENTKYLKQIAYITEVQQQAWYKSYLQNTDEIIFAIEETKDLKRIIGSMALCHLNCETPEFGKFMIGEQGAHGRRLGYFALKACLKVCFEQLKYKKCTLHVNPKNLAAMKIYQDAGFMAKNEPCNEQGEIEMEIADKRVRLIEFQQHGDDRGHLVVAEAMKEIPFEIKRIFYIYGSDSTVVRGKHANKKSEFVLINVAGSCKVRVIDREGKETIYNLDHPHMGLYLPTMVWKEMYDFSPDSVLLCLSNEHYDSAEYIRKYSEFCHYVCEVC